MDQMANIFVWGLGTALAVFAACCIGILISMTRRDVRLAREAARYARIEKIRAGRRERERKVLEWCARQIEQAVRERDAAWLRRVLR